MNRTFGTYLYLREDGTPYYVGKFSDKRRSFSKQHSVHVPPNESNILLQSFPSESDAFAAEMFLIAYYGRKDLNTGILLNRTDGGPGIVNPGPDTRKKMGASRKGKPRPYKIT